mgnify:CR=1 FL=1
MIGAVIPPGIFLLSVAAAVSAVLCIKGKYNQSQSRVFVFKPLTTVLLMGVAGAGGAIQTSYGSWVGLAMVFALLGDIFLMLPKDRFLQGLLSFLVAHLILIFAFTLEWSGMTWGLFLAVSVTALGMYAVLAPHVGRMRVPVAVYITVIGAMVWTGCERWLATGSVSGALAGTGAMLFMFSDSVLGLNRFRARFRSADLIVLSSYWLSLWLMVLSVRPGWM